jgi:hypothetical protein
MGAKSITTNPHAICTSVLINFASFFSLVASTHSKTDTNSAQWSGHIHTAFYCGERGNRRMTGLATVRKRAEELATADVYSALPRKTARVVHS